MQEEKGTTGRDSWDCISPNTVDMDTGRLRFGDGLGGWESETRLSD